MRLLSALLASLIIMTGAAAAQQDPQEGKKNANPCRDEVAAALQKLRNSSWFRMDTTMITENGLTHMTIDYVLPDRMHQKVNVVGSTIVQEVILIGDKAWSNEGQGWRILPADITGQLINQMRENVLTPQEDVGNYSCKGRVNLDGKDVMSYKLEDEPPENSTNPRNEAFRMFYVDAMTGLPTRNAIVTKGREDKPIFKTSYSFPLDLKVEAPKDAKPLEQPAASGAPATQGPASAESSPPAAQPAAPSSNEAPKAP
ncbi:MAG: hypothetical protein AB7S74_04640 [Hyphomicrobium sp.]